MRTFFLLAITGKNIFSSSALLHYADKFRQLLHAFADSLLVSLHISSKCLYLSIENAQLSIHFL